MIYINEAHTVDVWPVGLSAGTINYFHKTIQYRLVVHLNLLILLTLISQFIWIQCLMILMKCLVFGLLDIM